MTLASTSLLLFTSADLGDLSLFRAVRVDLSSGPGEGRLWVDLSRGNGVEIAWQRHLQRLADLAREHYDLPWDRADLSFSCRARGVVLDGASASLPLFVAWIALQSGVPLPEPFFATGVAVTGSDALAPAPRAYLQGKLDVADAYVRQVHGAATRHPIWVPRGSEYDAEERSSLDVREVGTLREAVLSILGVSPRAPIAQVRS